jgi:hypothetical protein
MIDDYYDFPTGSDFLSSRSITDADRDRGRKLARLRTLTWDQTLTANGRGAGDLSITTPWKGAHHDQGQG